MFENEFKTNLKRIKVQIENGKKKAIPKTTMWNRGQKHSALGHCVFSAYLASLPFGYVYLNARNPLDFHEDAQQTPSYV